MCPQHSSKLLKSSVAIRKEHQTKLADQSVTGVISDTKLLPIHDNEVYWERWERGDLRRSDAQHGPRQVSRNDAARNTNPHCCHNRHPPRTSSNLHHGVAG